MNSARLEAFSDGVIAIIITIMVLELKVPHGETMDALVPLVPNFLSYALSFIYVGIYWNNHHHMLHTCAGVTGQILWANLHLLFWLSLFSHHHGLDWGESLGRGALGAVWRGAADGFARILDTSATDHCLAGPGLAAQESRRRGFGKARYHPSCTRPGLPPHFARP